MKLYTAGLFVVLSISLLSSCAYIQGRKNQAETPSAPPVKKSQKVITQPQSPPVNTTPNPSTNASKMLNPLTQ